MQPGVAEDAIANAACLELAFHLILLKLTATEIVSEVKQPQQPVCS